MDESTVILRLGALEAPRPEAARERAIEEIPTRVRSARSRRRREPIPRLAAIFIVACLVLASLTLFTPPGRAVSSWVGDQLGFGQPGEHPTLRHLRHQLVYAPDHPDWTAGAGQAAYVLARGPMPHEAAWEFITYRSNRTGVHCFEVEIAKLRQLSSAGCEEEGFRLPREDGLSIADMSGNAAPGMKFQMVLGRLSSDVETARVEFDGRPVPVRVVEPSVAVFKKLGFHRTFKVFAAFPEGTERGGVLTVVAIEDGVPVGHVEARRYPDQQIMNREVCRSSEEDAKEGKMKERQARRLCRNVGIDPETLRSRRQE
ncbi:MAG: hypothetical protein QM729_19175 [Solirubrobacterales bacterium]